MKDTFIMDQAVPYTPLGKLEPSHICPKSEGAYSKDPPRNRNIIPREFQIGADYFGEILISRLLEKDR